jgi:hypothetical protein
VKIGRATTAIILFLLEGAFGKLKNGAIITETLSIFNLMGV